MRSGMNMIRGRQVPFPGPRALCFPQTGRSDLPGPRCRTMVPGAQLSRREKVRDPSPASGTALPPPRRFRRRMIHMTAAFSFCTGIGLKAGSRSEGSKKTLFFTGLVFSGLDNRRRSTIFISRTSQAAFLRTDAPGMPLKPSFFQTFARSRGTTAAANIWKPSF